MSRLATPSLAVVAVMSAIACGSKATTPASPAVTPGPGAPQNVAAVVSGPSQSLVFSVTLSWSPPTTTPAPTAYQVERAATSRADFTTFVTTRVTGTSTTIDFPFPAFRVSAWRVRALDGTVEGQASNVVSYTFALPASEGSLPAPTQLAPADRVVLNVFPRTTTFSWSAVAGAVAFGFEIDYCQPSNPWCLDGSQAELLVTSAHPGVPKPLTDTSFTFNFIGAQPGRWSVWALDAAGRMGAKSEWRSFAYAQ